MGTVAAELVRTSGVRIRAYDAKRRQLPPLVGRTMPELEGVQLGESRVFRLAVLSVDIRGFTKLSFDLGAELAKLARLQALFLSEMSAIIKYRGGVTEKYTGDGVLGLFGTESETTTSAAVTGAVNAALDVKLLLRRSLNPIFRDLGLPEIDCGQGIDFGPVIVERVGLRGENQFSLAGQTVSLAAKMQGVALAGQVIVGEDIRSRLSEQWKGYCKGPLEWKYRYPTYHLSVSWGE
jgi:adenylate cyclase